ncbi:hypothetical protein F4824DRAFT_490361 [Ustulina deusta]|nr:hypothetical protein F4824DRAFT_490361 [Ustulina deusta]
MGSLGSSNIEENAADGTSRPSPFNINRIAIVGAGPSGLAAAKHLSAEGFSSSQIDIYEQQADVGGVWNYSAVTSPEPPRVPQTDARAALDIPIYPETPKKPPIFPNPMYDNLHTNIPHTLMRYSDLGFTADGKGKGTHEDCEIFPSRQVVQEYILQYARDVRHLVRFSTQVTDISLQTPLPNTPEAIPGEQFEIRDKWTVRSTDLLTDVLRVESYDAVVVASGHYSTPYIPSVPEISAFATEHPGIISHSKTYRTASAFAGKRVVVVGSASSGLDIASQVSAVCASPLIISARSPIPDDMGAHLGVGDKVRVVGQIKRFLVNEKGIEVHSTPTSAAEGEENTERILDVDAILFCTGYLYTFPFISASSLPSSTPPLITDGRRVHGLARHFLHTFHPTLVFPALPIKVIPFPLAEAQAAVFSRLWSNRLPLPSREELQSWEREDEEGRGFEGERPGEGKSFHIFPKGGDARYINALHDWALRARKDQERAGGGKEPPFWGAEELWQRSIYAKAKIQFEKTGRKAKTLRELGFAHE